MITKTWLPVFSGFYGTIFECDFDNEIDYLRNDEKITEEIIDFFYSSDLYFDEYKNYNKEVSEKVTRIIEGELKALGFLKSIKFEELRSPREYNFANDAIDIKIVFTKKNVQNIKKFIEENYETWADYLRSRHTSYDGFLSSYDNSPKSKDWEDICECLTDSHKCGSILEFICIENEITEYTLYEKMEVYPYIDVEALKKEYNENLENQAC